MPVIAMDPAQPIPDAAPTRPGDAPPAGPYIGPSGRVVDPSADHDRRVYALFMHLGLAGWFVVGPLAVLIPLIMWLIKKDGSAFIDDHGREAVNFHISFNLYLLISLLFTFVCIGWVMLVATVVLAVVGMVLGSVAAHRGEYFRYPACIRLV